MTDVSGCFNVDQEQESHRVRCPWLVPGFFARFDAKREDPETVSMDMAA